MRSKKRYHAYFLVVVAVLIYTNGFSQNKAAFINARDRHLQYEGRVGFPASGASEIYWAGSSVKIKFEGTELKAILKDERGHNYFNVIIDDSVVQFLKIDTAKRTYTLASKLSKATHTVELFKRTDGKSGRTWFYGFWLSPHAKIRQPVKAKRMIEFYGNSVTVGSGIHEGDFPGGDENNYLSYAAVTARHFKARYTCIARSGIGLMVSWFSLIMPEMYDRLNPDDSTSKWDFSTATPQVVVIDLFQNDCALVSSPDHEQFKKRFGDKPPTDEFIVNAYTQFLKSIRGHYPGARIICTLGNMDAVKPGSPWPGYIEKAVALAGDKKIYTHFFTYKNTPDHPDTAEQKQMGESLIRFINEHINW